jgi:hypothetical protein
MHRSPRVVAHLIVGSRPEAYLATVLAAIEPVCAHAVINDNSGEPASPNAAAIAQSALARDGRLTLLHTVFEDFAAARNACIDATPKEFLDGWVLFVDADEVHGDELTQIAAALPDLPAEVDAVDGYSRHFVGSFAWWRTIERRLCFFRLSPERRWQGTVHERLMQAGRRAIIPAVWFHYGHVVPPRREWEKSRQYAALANQGWSPKDSDLLLAMPANVWGHLLRESLPFRGRHPAVARPLIAKLEREWAATFADVDRIARKRSLVDRIFASARAANWARLLAWRALEARVRWGWKPHRAPLESPLDARNDWQNHSHDRDDAARAGGRR